MSGVIIREPTMVPGDGRALLNPTVPPGCIFKTIEKYWKT